MDSEFSSCGEADDSANMAEITDPATQVDYIFNILLIGDSGVGKTDLIGRLCDEGFKTKFFATIGINMESHVFEYDGKRAKLQIWDPSGSERFRSVIIKHFQRLQVTVTGIIFVYDVNSPLSFQSVKEWLRDIQGNPILGSNNVKSVLLGNKCDVNRRAISAEQGEALGASYGMKYFETSTVTGQNVHRAFQTLCQDMEVNYQTPLIPQTPSTPPTEPVSPAF